MDDGHVIPEDIRALLERRTTFQEWLSKLGDLGSEFSPEVAGKVRDDYEGRLREVETELEGHRSELETALAARRTAVAEAAERHDARAAELEECELRYRVGEFDDEEWERRRDEHQSELDELDTNLTTQRAAVGALEAVLGELVGAGGVSALTADAASGEAIEAHDEVVVEPAVDIPDDLPVDLEEMEAAADDTGQEPWMTEPFEVHDTTLAAEAFEDAEEEETDAEVEVLEPPGDDEGETARPEDIVEAEVEVADEAEVELEPQGLEDEHETAEDEPAEFMDELEFLESLSLDDSDSFDAVSAMLDDEEEGGEQTSEPKTEDT